jgi:hypothetical protein
MKRRMRKLQLHRETLRKLGALQFRGVNGGAVGDCSHQVSENYTACPLDCGTDTGPIFTGFLVPDCPSYGAFCTLYSNCCTPATNCC